MADLVGEISKFFKKSENIGTAKTSAKSAGSESPIKGDMAKVYADPKKSQENWFKQQPYAFIFYPRKGAKSTFYLPIAPSNLNIVTHFATNVISTMYGTVEEHSEQRYYDISISGTTGMSPQFYDIIEDQKGHTTEVVGRAGYPVKTGVAGSHGIGGFFQRTQDLIKSAIGQARDVFNLNSKQTSGINGDRTGYVAFHNFYRWLLVYKKDTSGESGVTKRGRHPLSFVNFKDRNQYDVSISNFTLTRDSTNPMLYNYNIAMRAYNLRDPDDAKPVKDVQDRANATGLNGLDTPLFAKMSDKAKGAKNAAFGVIGAIKGFGR